MAGEASKKNIVVRYFIKLNLTNILLDAISGNIVIRNVLIETGHSIAIEIIGVDNFGGQTSKMFALEIEPSGETEVKTTASRKERGDAIRLCLTSLHDVYLISISNSDILQTQDFTIHKSRAI